MMPGFDQVAFGDLDRGQEGRYRFETAAIIIEPVMGEGGVRGCAAPISCARCASFATITACC